MAIFSGTRRISDERTTAAAAAHDQTTKRRRKSNNKKEKKSFDTYRYRLFLYNHDHVNVFVLHSCRQPPIYFGGSHMATPVVARYIFFSFFL